MGLAGEQQWAWLKMLIPGSIMTHELQALPRGLDPEGLLGFQPLLHVLFPLDQVVVVDQVSVCLLSAGF